MGGAALGFEEICNLRSGIVAEKLSERFLVEGDAMLFDEGDEIRGSEAGKSGFGEVGIRGEKIFRSGMDVGEVAATTAGDEDFFADAVGVLEYGHPTAAFAGLGGAEEAGGAGAEDQDVKRTGQKNLAVCKGQFKTARGGKEVEEGKGGRLVEGRGEFRVAEVVEQVGDLGGSDAIQGERRQIFFWEKLGARGFVAVGGSSAD